MSNIYLLRLQFINYSHKELHTEKCAQLKRIERRPIKFTIAGNTNMVENPTDKATCAQVPMCSSSRTNYKLPANEIWYWFVATPSYLFGTLFRHFVILSCFVVGVRASLFSVCSPSILWKCWKYLWVVQSMSALCADDVWCVCARDRWCETLRNAASERVCVSANAKWYIVYAFYPARVL